MPGDRRGIIVSLFADYGMLLVLLLLCLILSLATIAEQYPNGAAAGEALGPTLSAPAVVIVAGDSHEDRDFTAAVQRSLPKSVRVAAVVNGEPRDARVALERATQGSPAPTLIVCNHASAGWNVFGRESLERIFPGRADAIRVIEPPSYRWPNFLKRDNLLNIANQISVIAILAIGMTAVIITGGIDLSSGSLIALSAVIVARLIRDLGGAEQAGVGAMLACSLAAIAVCALAGAISGACVTLASIPPFIVTLAWMLIARGVAFTLSSGESIYQVPPGFTWLGRGESLFGLPNAVLLMALLYVAAHIVMERSVFGRNVYAIGGNLAAARSCGLPIRRVLIAVYALSGALAGLCGVVMASQLQSGGPSYGQMYELYTIAAVVVGGTSLSGGEGKIFGTLIGAFIIAVIQNGMNLAGVVPYTQMIVLGAVILLASLLDKLKQRRWNNLAN